MSSSAPGWLEGKVALITGGGSGIGKAVAYRYLQEGAQVIITGRNQEKLDAACAASPAPDRMVGCVADARSPQDMEQAVQTTLETFGALDILVPNAGIWDYNRSVTRVSSEELVQLFDELMSINVKGYLITVHAAWQELVKSCGNIVFTLSNASFHPAGGGAIYTASKFAGRGLVTQLAYELAPKVRVNGVAVGGMDTDLRGPASLGLNERSISDSFARSTLTGNNPLIPLHHASVDPSDFTGSYVLLASEQNSSNITGQIIQADGGIAVRGFGDRAAGGDHL